MKSYVLKEFCAQHESQEDQEIWWSHIKEEENMLFILDGLDELAPEHKEPIYALLRGNIFDKVNDFREQQQCKSISSLRKSCQYCR